MAQWVHHVFLPWCYAEELKKVNERSAEGHHLIRASAFSKREEEDSGKVYRYALDCQRGKGFTELLYEKQGWELCCRHGNFLWFRKLVEEGRQETEYEIHGEGPSGVEEELRRAYPASGSAAERPFDPCVHPGTGARRAHRRLDARVACVPLFLCLPPVLAAEKMRKVLGEEKRK